MSSFVGRSAAHGASPAEVSRVEVLRIAPDRVSQRAGEELYVGGVARTHGGGWMRVETSDHNVPAVVRKIEVHLGCYAPEDNDTNTSMVVVCIDRIRFADIQWRSVRAFHEAFGNVRESVLVLEAARALKRAKASGVRPRVPPR